MHLNRLAAALAVAAACTVSVAGASAARADAPHGVRAAHLASSYAFRDSPLWVSPAGVRPPQDRFTLAVAHADLNRDGYMDLFMGSGVYRDGFVDERVPLEVWLGGPDGFTEATDAVIGKPSPGMVHPRKALVGDYNSDGWPDVLFLGHGFDQPPFPGEYNQLFLSNGDGTLDYSPVLEPWVGFHHGGSAADVDGDGRLDVVTISWEPKLMTGDGAGGFTARDIDLGGGGFFTATLVDMDRDGHMDLLAGGHEFEGARTAVYWGDGSGGFNPGSRTLLPKDAAFGIVVDLAAEDISGDGRPDIVASRTGHEPFYSGRKLQVILQTGDRTFKDETYRRIEMDTTLEWIEWIRIQDIDGDGAPDLLAEDRRHAANDAVWRNNGRGTFYAHDGGVAPQVRRWRNWPGDFDGDGRDDILWRNTVTGEAMGWAGGNASESTPLPPLPMDWDVAGVGDFDGDGADDILARNTRTGENTAWSALDEDAMPVVGTLDDLDWDAAGVGDFDGDGRADILWRHAVSGANMVWPAGEAAASEPLPRVDVAWAVGGIGDFDGDGVDDVLWRNSTRGTHQIWHAASSADRRTVGMMQDAWWRIAHVADFDADGVDDILWHHARRGINRYWRGGYAREVKPLARVLDPLRELAGVGDYDGDGRPDLLWRHLETGALQLWLKGNPRTRRKITPPADVAWRPVS